MLAGCTERSTQPGGPVFTPGAATLLSVGSTNKDEDPSVLRAQNGTVFVAWFSHRNGNADIYVTDTRDGVAWDSVVRVTTSTDGDFYPNLLQDNQGLFHLVWFRWNALFRGNIVHNTSVDGGTWITASEELVTTEADVDDWVPVITQTSNGTLLVFFVSDKRDTLNPASDIYVTSKGPSDIEWAAAVPVPGINSVTEHDHLPFTARTGNEVKLVWMRHDTTQALPYLNPKSHLYYSTSTDGMIWAAPTAITNDTDIVAHVFPAFYATHAGTWNLIWITTRTGAPAVVELPLADISNYPAALTTNTQLGNGYSHRVAATPTPGVYLGAWVQSAGVDDTLLDVYYRVFAK